MTKLCVACAQFNWIQESAYFIIDYQHRVVVVVFFLLAQYIRNTLNETKVEEHRARFSFNSIQFTDYKKRWMRTFHWIMKQKHRNNQRIFLFLYSHVLARFCSNKYQTKEKQFFFSFEFIFIFIMCGNIWPRCCCFGCGWCCFDSWILIGSADSLIWIFSFCSHSKMRKLEKEGQKQKTQEEHDSTDNC